eukprot:TRINITY_DN11639_c0_g1_i1.p1 TRINITY_DN11639_c0_g1~~TRINITY_DN11639_c0_g1_i1.p1  ORF type:complete len:382 (-),score=65.97 TRINITY_DN11639_c0_g1_i1:80-1225(-)
MARCEDLLDDLVHVDIWLATQLRADVEANLAEESREHAASGGRSRIGATPSLDSASWSASRGAPGYAPDLTGSLREDRHSNNELPQTVVQLIQAEVNRAIDQHTAQIRADMLQASGSMRRSLDQLLSVIQGELRYWDQDDQASPRKRPVAAGLESLPAEFDEETENLFQTVKDQLQQEAGEARRNMDSQIAEQLRNVVESCQALAEECWSDAGWQEMENPQWDQAYAAQDVCVHKPPASLSRWHNNPWPSKDMPAVLACPRHCSRACERNTMAAERLQELLVNTVAVVELESKARQESELCLSGQLSDLRTKVGGSMSRLLTHLEKHSSTMKFVLDGHPERLCCCHQETVEDDEGQCLRGKSARNRVEASSDSMTRLVCME